MPAPKRSFAKLAKATSRATGRPLTFLLALLVIVVWAITGPLFGFSDTWQLVINTGTTIVTFLMVFLIQNTQNRDSEAMQVKLDEIIRALEGAHNGLLDLEELEEAELDRVRERYEELARRAREGAKLATGCPDLDESAVNESAARRR
jgi:low affinity Fe/Cu permease